MAIRRVTSVFALLAVALWLGGLIALGALAAPVVFSTVALPASADTMVIVFRRFDVVAMICAAILLGSEATRAFARFRFAAIDVTRAAASAAAAAAAVFQGTWVSPGIAALHAAGVIRGVGAKGAELSRMHDVAEWGGQAQVLLLGALVVLHVLSLSAEPRPDRVGGTVSAPST